MNKEQVSEIKSEVSRIHEDTVYQKALSIFFNKPISTIKLALLLQRGKGKVGGSSNFNP